MAEQEAQIMPTDTTPTDTPYLTIGMLAERLRLPIHRIGYAVSVGRIKPAMRIGITRVWHESDVATVRRVLNRVAVRKGAENTDAELTCA